MAASKTHRAAQELRIAQAWYEQGVRHRLDARSRPISQRRTDGFRFARNCFDSARYHLAQCGGLLGLNGWPK